MLKIANIFDVSVDYLLNRDRKSTIEIQNQDLLKKVEEIDQLPQEEQKTIIDLLDAYVKRSPFRQMMQG